MTTEDAVIYLASCAVNEKIPDKDLISEIDPEEVLKFAKRHSISCCVAIALESAGIKTAETAKAIAQAMRRNAVFENSLEEVTAGLEEAGIWYVLLKGIILKKYYPKPFMREMADHDILYDASRAEELKEIMERMGFTTASFDDNRHDVYRKKPLLNYEMHRSLFDYDYDKKISGYYRDTKDLSRPEDFYLYTVAHEYKHYSDKGTGLRSLIDIYLYLNKEELDWNYIEKEAEKLGIREFERDNRQLAVALFGKGETTDEQMLSYILSSNSYGNSLNRIKNRIDKSKGKHFGYMLKRIGVPMRASDPGYRIFSKRYPYFYRHKILLPLLPFYRIICSVKSGRLKSEWKILRSHRKGT